MIYDIAAGCRFSSIIPVLSLIKSKLFSELFYKPYFIIPQSFKFVF